jgi:hypothetical protein
MTFHASLTIFQLNPSKHYGYYTACLNIKKAAFAHRVFLRVLFASQNK